MIRHSELQYAMCNFLKTFKEYQNTPITIQTFSDGWAFATILRSATHFKLSLNDLIDHPDKWTFKLNNLKKILNAIEDYFETEVKKVIKTKDIDLVQISKNNNVLQMSKFFEAVVAVMTEAPNKEDHIGVIMGLDERSQTIFVDIIQNLLETRVIQTNEQGPSVLNFQLENENSQLRSQVQNLLSQNMQLQKIINELQLKNQDLEEQLRNNNGDKMGVSSQEPKEKQHLRTIIQNLKEKLYYTVRESEQKISLFREQIISLENKLIKYDEIEEELSNYKKKYAEIIESYGKAKSYERERIKLNRMIDEKDQSIRKLQEKVEEVNELNYSMQEKEVYLKMQLQKRDVRFKQLEKQVKKKFETSAPTSISDGSLNGAILSQEISQVDHEQLQQLRNESDKNRRKIREIERENKKLKRSLQRVPVLESQKKRLQKIIIDANRDRIDQIDLLVQALSEIYSQSQRKTKLLEQNKIAH